MKVYNAFNLKTFASCAVLKFSVQPFERKLKALSSHLVSSYRGAGQWLIVTNSMDGKCGWKIATG